MPVWSFSVWEEGTVFHLMQQCDCFALFELRREQCGLGALKDHDVIACMMSAEPGHAVTALKHTCALL